MVILLSHRDRLEKDGSNRFCVDYRRLNRVTVDENAPPPIIHETIGDLGQAKVFSSIDLKSGYWQVPMASSAKKFIAFSTPDGAHYQFQVTPFVLKNAPATFQKLMAQEVLAVLNLRTENSFSAQTTKLSPG